MQRPRFSEGAMPGSSAGPSSASDLVLSSGANRRSSSFSLNSDVEKLEKIKIGQAEILKKIQLLDSGTLEFEQTECAEPLTYQENPEESPIKIWKEEKVWKDGRGKKIIIKRTTKRTDFTWPRSTLRATGDMALPEFDQIIAAPAGKPTSLVGDPLCSVTSNTGTDCDDPSMLRWLQKKPSANQEQPLVSNYGGQYDTYPEDLDATENNKASPIGVSDDPKEADETEKGTPILSKNVSLYKGLFYSSMSSVFFSLSSTIVKYVDDITPGELAVLRFVGILIFTLPLVIYSREEPFGPKPARHLLILRGIVGATSLFLRFVAFRYLPLADASVIVFSIPVFVSVLARIFLKEPCGFFHAFTVFLTLLGIVLLTKLPIIDSVISKNSPTYFYGISAALGSTIFGASVYVVIRKMTSVHHSVIMFNFGWVAIIETVILTFITGEFKAPSCGFEQWLVILLGIFSFCGQMLLTLALKQEHAGPVAVVRAATDIVLAFIWQIWFFNEIPDVFSISGAVLVSSCVVLISVRKWVMSLPEHSSIRKKLYLLTI